MLRELLHPLFSCVCVLRESLPFRLIFLRFPQPPLQSPSLQDARQLSRQLLRQVPPLSFCGPISLRRAFWPQQEHPRQLFWHGRVFSVQELQRERALQREQALRRERALRQEQELQRERALRREQALAGFAAGMGAAASAGTAAVTSLTFFVSDINRPPVEK